MSQNKGLRNIFDSGLGRGGSLIYEFADCGRHASATSGFRSSSFITVPIIAYRIHLSKSFFRVQPINPAPIWQSEIGNPKSEIENRQSGPKISNDSTTARTGGIVFVTSAYLTGF